VDGDVYHVRPPIARYRLRTDSHGCLARMRRNNYHVKLIRVLFFLIRQEPRDFSRRKSVTASRSSIGAIARARSPERDVSRGPGKKRPPAVTNNQSGVTRRFGRDSVEEEEVELMRPKETVHESTASARVLGTDSG